ncbi:MAG: HEPN domain-containing protein [Oscillospiraceae bacterium]|nr:HEPN domain-containing protein [Oscillospiraceae bacterium]
MKLDIIGKINTFLETSAIICESFDSTDESKSVYYKRDDDAWFSYYNDQLKNIVIDLIKSDSEIDRTVSNEGVYSTLLELMYNAKKSEEICCKSNFNIITNVIKEKPVIEWEIFHKIYGLTVDRDDPYEIGDYRLYNYDSFRKHIDDVLAPAYSNTVNDLLLTEVKAHDTIVSVIVQARDSKKAQELAYINFDVIQNVFRFFVSYWNLSYFDIGILNYRKDEVDTWIAASKETESVHFGNELLGKVITLEFSEFQNRSIKYDFSPIGIVERYCARNHSKMEKRLFAAIQLLGRSVYDLGTPMGFLQSMMAIEALIQMNAGGLVNQSISAQIAEYCAFLLDDTCEKRIETEKLIKKLYKVRSRLAHGSLTECSIEDCKDVLYNARDLVEVFFRNDTLKGFADPEELQEYIKCLKYKE